MARRPFSVFALLLTIVSTVAGVEDPTLAQRRAELDRYVAPVLEAGHVVGMAIGWFEGDLIGFAGYGWTSADQTTVPDRHTLYEIGSVSKVFTGVLLAEAVARGLVALEDPVAELLPPDVTMPEPRERPISLLDLTTHTSGLPRMPDNFRPADASDPYADYTVEQMYEFLADHELRRAPEVEYEYSNLGVGLLGHVLALRANADRSDAQAGSGAQAVSGAHDAGWEGLMRAWIAEPLGMADTWVTLDAEHEARFAPAHDPDLTSVSPWRLPTFAGAGSVRSTAADMLAFLRASSGLDDSPLRRSMGSALTPRRRYGKDGWVALGWHVVHGGTRWTHSGQTGGYHACVILQPEYELGAVLLTNTATGMADGALWQFVKHLAGEDSKPPVIAPPVDVPREVLQRYVGAYAFMPGYGVEVELREHGLEARVTGQPFFRLYASSETAFDYRVVPASITFEPNEGGPDEGGAVQALVLHQGGRDMRADRMP